MDSDRMGAERMDAHPRPGWIWADWIWADRIRTGTLGKASISPASDIDPRNQTASGSVSVITGDVTGPYPARARAASGDKEM